MTMDTASRPAHGDDAEAVRVEGRRAMTEQNETFRDPSPEEHWDDLVAKPWVWFDSAWVLKDCAMIIGERFVADLLAETPPGGKVTEGMPFPETV